VTGPNEEIGSQNAIVSAPPREGALLGGIDIPRIGG